MSVAAGCDGGRRYPPSYLRPTRSLYWQQWHREPTPRTCARRRVSSPRAKAHDRPARGVPRTAPDDRLLLGSRPPDPAANDRWLARLGASQR